MHDSTCPMDFILLHIDMFVGNTTLINSTRLAERE